MNDNLYVLEQIGRQLRDERLSRAGQVHQARLLRFTRALQRAGQTTVIARRPAQP